MKKLLLYMTILFVSTHVWSQNINKAQGWLESAFVEWTPVDGADSYNVYYTGGGQTDKKIDTQLIRSYGTYFRADILGLAVGTYTITIKPMVSGAEQTGVTTSGVTVLPHDRSGFAHFNYSDIGAYKNDGTLKNGARVIYVSANTAKTVTCTVGGVVYTGLQTIIDAYSKGTDNTPLNVRIIGTIDAINMDKFSSSEEGLQIKGKSAYSVMNISMEGVGNDATIRGFGILIRNAKSVELRNFAIMLCMDDSVSLDTANSNCWVHNLDLFYGKTGSAADQAKGDGTLDMKGNSKYLTLSYNHFWDSGKMSLCGMTSETGENFISYHHNWFDHSDSRHPRVRTMTVHVYNNYFDGNSKYGTGATTGSNVFVESNYFRNVNKPMLISKQGTDIYSDPKGNFSGEEGGMIKAYGNVFAEKSPNFRLATQNEFPTNFDCYDATAANEVVPSSYKTLLGAKSYNNFDTDPAKMYTYTAHEAADVPSIVTGQYGAGRMQNGDFKFSFNNAVDDESYGINTELKNAITNYTSKMVSIQGETIPVGNQTLVATTNNNNQTVSTGYAINNIVFTWGGDATDAAVTGLPNGITGTKNTTAKTLTLSGIPTETMEYIVTTTGSAGIPSSDSGTITVLPPSSQILNSTSNNNNQTITIGTAIAPIIFTWSGDATDADVSDLPNGVTATKNELDKTITISGTPTDVNTDTYTVTTSGSIGTPVVISGTIKVNAAVSGDVIHNFTVSGETSSFYSITGNMSSTAGTQNYDSTALTARLKMESATRITYTTTATSTLTLVFDADFVKKVKFTIGTDIATNTTSHTATTGIVTIENIAAGTYTISKGDTTNLFYIKTSYGTLGLNDNVLSSKLTLYPNPVADQLYFSSLDQKIENVTIYNLLGAVVKTVSNVGESIDVSNLNAGSYLVKITTDQGTTTQKIIKK